MLLIKIEPETIESGISYCWLLFIYKMKLEWWIVDYICTVLTVLLYGCLYLTKFIITKCYNKFNCPFYGPLIPLFWTSGDVSSGFQSQSGFCLIQP